MTTFLFLCVVYYLALQSIEIERLRREVTTLRPRPPDDELMCAVDLSDLELRKN